MTNKEAIAKMEQQKNAFLDEYVDYGGVTEAYNMAISALEAQEPCKDVEVQRKRILKEVCLDIQKIRKHVSDFSDLNEDMELYNLSQLGATYEDMVSNQIKSEPITPIRDYMVNCDDGDELDGAIRELDDLLSRNDIYCVHYEIYGVNNDVYGVHYDMSGIKRMSSWFHELKQLRAEAQNHVNKGTKRRKEILRRK